MTNEDTNSELETTDSEPQDTKEGELSESEPELSVDDLVEGKTKDEKRKLNEESIAKSEALKFLSGEKSLDQVPEWVRNKYFKQLKNEPIDSEERDDRVAEIEAKFQSQIDELRKEKIETQKKSDKEASKELVSTFLGTYNMTATEFDRQYGSKYFSEVERLMSMGHSRADATKYALADISMEQLKESKETSKASAGYTIPSGGSIKKSGVTKRLTARQIEIAKECGHDPEKIYN